MSNEAFSLPPFPLPVRVAMRAWEAAARIGIGIPDFDETRLVAEARRRTGLHYFGDEDFFVPMRRLLRAFEEEADLHLLGRAVMRGATVRALECRLRVRNLFDHHPELAALPIDRPVFITGLQRSGTTKMHRLLACAPELRPLTAVEGLRPVPMGRPIPDEPGDHARRARQARLAERGMKYLSPALFAIHPIEADAPEEDFFLFDVTFMSPAVDASLSVPSFTRWIREVDQRPLYEYVRQLIRLLLWQRPGRYLGKTPHYQENIDLLLDVFPEAKVIHTHRDPQKVVPSFASMMAHTGATLARHVDPREVGRRVLRQMANGVDRAIVSRSAVADDRVLDVHYLEVMRDPERQMHRIFEFLELRWDEAAKANVKRWLESNPQNKHGRHRYAPEHFGLDPDEIDERFKAYRERFDVEPEEPLAP